MEQSIFCQSGLTCVIGLWTLCDAEEAGRAESRQRSQRLYWTEEEETLWSHDFTETLNRTVLWRSVSTDRGVCLRIRVAPAPQSCTEKMQTFPLTKYFNNYYYYQRILGGIFLSCCVITSDWRFSLRIHINTESVTTKVKCWGVWLKIVFFFSACLTENIFFPHAFLI